MLYEIERQGEELFMRIAVCDDEKYFVDNIIERIQAYGVEDVLPNKFDGYTDPCQLLNHFKMFDYDLVYLDIKMNDKCGVDVAKEIKRIKSNCIVIFVSSYDEYIHESYRVEAFQFLKKPVEEELFNLELKRAITKYKRLNKSFVFTTTIGNKLVKANNIIFLETSYGNYKLYTTNETYFGTCKSIADTKQELLDSHFYQLNRRRNS